jgi:hypothetical protein
MFLEYTVLAPKKKKKGDDEEDDGKRYDWAVVLGGTKYDAPPSSPTTYTGHLTQPQQ